MSLSPNNGFSFKNLSFLQKTGLTSSNQIFQDSDGIGSGERYFGSDGTTYPWYVATKFNAIYDATGNKTWATYMGWDGVRRVVYVRVFDHSNNTWSQQYLCGTSTEVDDDHGPPSIILLADGRFVVYWGLHNQTVYSSYTTNVRDPSNWTLRPSFASGMTYWHPVLAGGKVTLLMREIVSAQTRYTGVMYVSTSISNGVITYGSKLTFGDFGADSRYYLGPAREKGGKIHFLSTRANYVDEYRRDVFYLIFDPVTGDISNIDGSYTVTQATWSVTPISLADHQTYFRIYTHDVSAPLDVDKYAGNIPSFDFDADGNPHVVLFNGKSFGTGYYGGGFADIDVVHIKWTGSSWTTPYNAGYCSQKYDGAGITHLGSNRMQIMYTSDPSPNDGGNNYRGGNMYTRIREANGTWNDAVLIASQDTPWALDIPNEVLNGHSDLRWIFAEKSTSVNFDAVAELNDVKAGYQRVFAYGDRGFVKAPHDRTINLSCTQISAGRSIGDILGILTSGNARSTYSIVSDPDSKFSIIDNTLKLAATVTSGNSHSVTIRSTLRGVTIDRTFTLSVIAASVVDKLSVEYLLNEGSGKLIIDNTPRKFNGFFGEDPNTTTSNEPTRDSAGLVFGTSGSKKTMTPYNPALQATGLHIFLAVKCIGSTAGMMVNFSEGFDGRTKSWHMSSSFQKVAFSVFNSTGSSAVSYTTTANMLTTGNWHLIEVIMNGTTLKIRANGAGEETFTAANALRQTVIGSLNIGERFPPTANFNGAIGYLAIAPVELTGTDLSDVKARAVAAMAAKGVTLTVV
jgi:hypothetical protein